LAGTRQRHGLALLAYHRPLPGETAMRSPTCFCRHVYILTKLCNAAWQADVADIKIRPILLHKGNVRLAIYGLGNIRDERLVQTFKANKVSAYIHFIFCDLFPSKSDPNTPKYQRRLGHRCFSPILGGGLHPRAGLSLVTAPMQTRNCLWICLFLPPSFGDDLF